MEGFAGAESLYAICDTVIHAVKDREGGHWLCNIWPYDIEIGLALNDYVKFLGLDFEREKVQYRVIVAQTAEEQNTNPSSMFCEPQPQVPPYDIFQDQELELEQEQEQEPELASDKPVSGNGSNAEKPSSPIPSRNGHINSGHQSRNEHSS